jgi:hypothetical protein
LFVPTSFNPQIGGRAEGVDALLKVARAEMMGRIYFMKKPWSGLMKGSTIPLVFLKYMNIVDYGKMEPTRRVLMENETLISELAYFFGEGPSGGMSMASNGIRLFFDTPSEVGPYVDGLVSRFVEGGSVGVSPATSMIVIKLPGSRNGIPILLGSRSESL